MANYVKIALGSLVLLALGASIGYTFVPTKVVTVTKVVTKTVRERIVNRDVNTRITHSIDEHGNPVTIIERIDHSVEHGSSTSGTTSNTSSTTERANKDWMISAGIGIRGLSGQDQEFIGSISRRLVGNVYLGVIGTSTKHFGAGVTLVF